MIKKSLFIFILLTSIMMHSQEKKLWAKSYINKKAPELVVEKWLTEQPDTQGKFILIDFWATWCGPCIEAIPDLNEYHEEFKDDMVVIGISDEPKQTVKKFKKTKIDYYSAIDTASTTSNILGVQGIPHCIIINPEGIVVWEGYPDLEGFELTSEVIEELINKSK